MQGMWRTIATFSWLAVASAAYADTLSVPAFTAYSEPRPEALRFSEQFGVTRWRDASDRLAWYGEIKNPGKLDISLSIRVPDGESVSLRLTAAKKVMTATVKGTGDQAITVPFGSVEIAAPGYQSFMLEGISKTGTTFGSPQTLLLDGPASINAHFNLKERRNAASVHLGYPIPNDSRYVNFYNEVTVRTEPLWSYYMACGFNRGYFGIQVNSPTERRIIFSIWDSGNEGVSRDKVAAEDKVQLIEKGEGVVADSFGNEGTGGHSHLVYSWKKDETYRFLVTAKPEGTSTIYSGWFYFPEKKQWGLIASFRAPKDGGYLRGLYSFNENFSGSNGQLQRLAEFGNGWAKNADGKWIELLTARFTHDGTGKLDRKDYSSGTRNGRFFLSNGGFLNLPKVELGNVFQREPSGPHPKDFPSPAGT